MIAWVVGASGTWGRAVAGELLARGIDVVGVGRHDVPELAAEALRRGRRWSFEPLDLLHVDVPRERLARLEPVPDVLVICAVSTVGDRAAMTRANFLSPAALVEQVLGRMRDRGSGRIGVFVAQNARLGLGGLGDYSAAQGALWTWCEAVQAALASETGRVTLTRVIPPRAPSATQRFVSERSGHSARLHPPDARGIVAAILTGKRRAGRRPVLAALAMLVR